MKEEDRQIKEKRECSPSKDTNAMEKKVVRIVQHLQFQKKAKRWVEEEEEEEERMLGKEEEPELLRTQIWEEVAVDVAPPEFSRS